MNARTHKDKPNWLIALVCRKLGGKKHRRHISFNVNLQRISTTFGMRKQRTFSSGDTV
jgi:hypothetical protein